jgi:formylglycine-generating enzyme required for sulfatase activity
MEFPASVSTFLLDKYEVTVGRFRTFVQAGMGTQVSPPATGSGAHAKVSGSGWDAAWNAHLPADRTALADELHCLDELATWTDNPDLNEDRPINCINWYEAMAFCIWDGGYLATESEWGYAASGGDEQRVYPWSSPATSLDIDTTRASYNDGTGCVGDGMRACAITDLLLVGSNVNGAGRWGHLDLAGNVFEWTLDTQGVDLLVYPTPCADCANLVSPPGTTDRMLRSGAYDRGIALLRAATRTSSRPGSGFPEFGIRCARAQ